MEGFEKSSLGDHFSCDCLIRAHQVVEQFIDEVGCLQILHPLNNNRVAKLIHCVEDDTFVALYVLR